MSQSQKESCAFCKSYLFDDDDIVYCPVCGAPHHRECYNQIGRCALESAHGTEYEYSKLKKSDKDEEHPVTSDESANKPLHECDYCHEKYPAELLKCPTCNRPNIERYMQNSGVDIFGNVPKDYMFDENVSADDVRKFVMANTQRYLPKFALLSKKRKASWNWIAFIFPSGWFMARKMYIQGIFVTLLTVISSFFTLPLSEQLYELMPTVENARTSYFDAASTMESLLPGIAKSVVIFAAVGIVISLAIRFVSAILGDWIYKNHVMSEIKKIKSDIEDIDEAYLKKGGINFFLFAVALFATYYLPEIIYSLI